jgi:hypothetical protein
MAVTNYYSRVYKPAAVKAGVPWGSAVVTVLRLTQSCAGDRGLEAAAHEQMFPNTVVLFYSSGHVDA